MIATLAMLALAGAGCGGDDDSGVGASGEAPPGTAAEDEGTGDSGDGPFDRDACELLTGADIDAVLGEAVDGRFIQGDESTSTPGQCEWMSGDGTEVDDPVPDGIVLFLGDEQVFDNTRILAESGNDYETLEGIGDEAYVGAGEGGVRIGETGITVTPIGVRTSAPATHELIVDLLARVAANH